MAKRGDYSYLAVSTVSGLTLSASQSNVWFRANRREGALRVEKHERRETLHASPPMLLIFIRPGYLGPPKVYPMDAP